MSRKYLMLFLILITTIISCNSDQINVGEINDIPFSNGVEWEYFELNIIKKYNSISSSEPYSVDTLKYDIREWIDKDTLLNDTIHLKVFKEQTNNKNIYSSYKFRDNEGVKLYATRLTVHNPPFLEIALPLQIDSKWLYNDSRIEKEVIGSEIIKLNGNEYKCLKVQWNYLTDSDVIITEWISDIGLVKKKIQIGKTQVLDEKGEPMDTFISSFRILELRSFKE